jgi:hypothetical protein
MTSDGKYITLQIAPTVNKNTSEYNAEGFWTDSDLIRFKNGMPQKIGGWQANGDVFLGVPRFIHAWVELNGTKHYVVGTNKKLQIQQDNVVYDITPIETSTSTSSVISTSAGSTLAIVSVPTHNRKVGDFIGFTSVATVSVGGIDFQGRELVVTSVISNNAFQVETSVTATSDVPSSGGATKLDFLLTTGGTFNGTAAGWGAGTWDTPGASASSGWSDPRGGSTVSVGLRQWTGDNWGEDLIVCPKGGYLYLWDASTSVQTRATVISAAPSTNNVFAIGHPDRFAVVYGTIPEGGSSLDPLQIRWSDREDYNTWTTQPTNRAGGIRLEGGSYIVGVANTKQETLVFTDTAVYSQQPTNDSFVFSFDLMSHNAGAISPHGAAAVDSVVYWMGAHNFYVYNGVVDVLPCTVRDFLFADLDFNQKEKVFAGVIREFNEVIWFYQSVSSTNDIDKYVKYNYKENAWDVGVLERPVWLDSTVYQYPIAINASGVSYNHEIGVDADASAMSNYITSSYFDLEDGTNMLLLDQFVPDFVESGLAYLTIFTKKTPDSVENQKGPYNITTATEYINMKARGRQAKLKFSSDTVGANWQLGKPRYRVKPDGGR